MVQVEHRGADVPHDLLQVVDDRVEPLSNVVGADPRQNALEGQAGGEDPLNHMIVQVPGDAIPVGQHAQLVGLPGRFREAQRQRRLVGETGDQGQIVPGERRRPLGTQCDQHIGHRVPRPQWRRQHRPESTDRSRALEVVTIAHHRHAGGECETGDGTVHRNPRPDRSGSLVSGGGGDYQRLHLGGRDVGVLRDEDERGRRSAQVQCSTRHQRENLVGPCPRQQLGSDVGGGLNPGQPCSRLLEEPRILDGDTGRRGQRPNDRLVFFGEELSVFLLGQIQIAEHRLTDLYGDTEERGHIRVVVGESDRCRVVGEPVESQKAWVVDELSEHASTAGQPSDFAGGVGIHSVMNEFDQIPSGSADSERPVAGADQIDGALDDRPQRDVEIEVRGHRQHGGQQTSSLLPVSELPRTGDILAGPHRSTPRQPENSPAFPAKNMGETAFRPPGP